MIIRVRSPSDYSTYTSIEIEGMGAREYTVYPTRHRRNDRGEDPTFKAIRDVIVATIGKEARLEGVLFKVKGYGMLIRKVGNRYTLNAMKHNFGDIMNVVTRVLMRSIYVDSDRDGKRALDSYLIRCMEMPMELSYVLENRVPYKYFTDEGELSECRLNVAQVGPTDFALELNSAFWYDITLKQLKQFVNSYLKDDRRGKFYAISPEELVYVLSGNKASDAQIAVIKAFVSQNRQAENVEKRAMELLEDMAKNYKQVKTIQFKSSADQEPQVALAIQGKLTDWIIADNGMKRGVQDVSTYMLQKGDEGNHGTKLVKLNKLKVDKGVHLVGPICIDNMMSGAAKGDQYAARAMAVMNDNVLGSYVSTVKRYLENITENSDLAGRFNWDAL